MGSHESLADRLARQRHAEDPAILGAVHLRLVDVLTGVDEDEPWEDGRRRDRTRSPRPAHGGEADAVERAGDLAVDQLEEVVGEIGPPDWQRNPWRDRFDARGTTPSAAHRWIRADDRSKTCLAEFRSGHGTGGLGLITLFSIEFGQSLKATGPGLLYRDDDAVQ